MTTELVSGARLLFNEIPSLRGPVYLAAPDGLLASVIGFSWKRRATRAESRYARTFAIFTPENRQTQQHRSSNLSPFFAAVRECSSTTVQSPLTNARGLYENESAKSSRKTEPKRWQ